MPLPPLTLFIYSRYENPADAKSTLQVVFLTATLLRLFNIVCFGNGVSLEIIRIGALSVPVVIGFTVMGYMLTRRFSAATFLKIVYSFIGLAGVLNIFKGLQ